jgi:hypothetical protein
MESAQYRDGRTLHQLLPTLPATKRVRLSPKAQRPSGVGGHWQLQPYAKADTDQRDRFSDRSIPPTTLPFPLSQKQRPVIVRFTSDFGNFASPTGPGVSSYLSAKCPCGLPCQSESRASNEELLHAARHDPDGRRAYSTSAAT